MLEAYDFIVDVLIKAGILLHVGFDELYLEHDDTVPDIEELYAGFLFVVFTKIEQPTLVLRVWHGGHVPKTMVLPDGGSGTETKILLVAAGRDREPVIRR